MMEVKIYNKTDSYCNLLLCVKYSLVGKSVVPVAYVEEDIMI